MSNSYIIYRIEPDGSETPISYVGDEMEIPGAIFADQEMTHYNAGYHAEIVRPTKQTEREKNMKQLADAPWIRKAERWGMPEGSNVYCPCCHEENPKWFYTDCGDVVGCSECIDWKDPFRDAEDG